MKFVIDMNLSPTWVAELAARGHEAVHWRDIGTSDAPDEEIIAWAASNGRTVLTADLDFGAAIVALAGGPSVVQLRCGSTHPARVGALVAQAIEVTGSELRGGAVVTIEFGRIRVRRRLYPSPAVDDI